MDVYRVVYVNMCVCIHDSLRFLAVAVHRGVLSNIPRRPGSGYVMESQWPEETSSSRDAKGHANIRATILYSGLQAQYKGDYRNHPL